MVFTEEKRQCEKNMKKKTREGAKSTGCSARKGPKRLNGSVRTPKRAHAEAAVYGYCEDERMYIFFSIAKLAQEKKG